MTARRANQKKTTPIPWGKWLAGLLLLIPGFFFTLVLVRHLGRFQFVTPVQLAFVTGAGVYLVMHLLLWKPVFIHVMGHELTHAFWAVMLGGRIKSLLVSKEGGQVTLSKTNFFIALAPYFFPLYTFILLPIYFIAAPKFYPVLAFFIGMSLAFHVALTLFSLRDRQSDVNQVGAFFSLSFVYVMNIIVIALVLSVMTPEVITLGSFFGESWRLFAGFMLWLYDWMAVWLKT